MTAKAGNMLQQTIFNHPIADTLAIHITPQHCSVNSRPKAIQLPVRIVVEPATVVWAVLTNSTAAKPEQVIVPSDPAEPDSPPLCCLV